jgi:collagen type VII alpha
MSWNGSYNKTASWNGVTNLIGANGSTGATGPQGPQGFSTGAIYYFNLSQVDVPTGFSQMSLIPLFTAGQLVNVAGPTTGAFNYATFITDVGNPGVISINAGNWIFDLVMSLDVPFTNQFMYAEIGTWDGTTFSSINAGEPVELIAGAVNEHYRFGVAVPTTAITLTDRIVVKFWVENIAVAETFTAYYEDDDVGQVITSLSAAVAGATGPTGPTGPAGSAANAALWSQYPALQTVDMDNFGLDNVDSITGNVILPVDAETIRLTADTGINIINFSDIDITAENGNRGRVNILAEPGFNNGIGGEVHITANGGSIPLTGVGSGGLIELIATTPALTGLSSAIKMNAASVLSYAGVVPIIGSLAGYNYMYGTAGTNILAGIPSIFPNIPGTNYLYGAAGLLPNIAGTRIENTLGVDKIVPLSSFTNLVIQGIPGGATTSLATITSIDGATGPGGVPAMPITNVSSINGIPFPLIAASGPTGPTGPTGPIGLGYTTLTSSTTMTIGLGTQTFTVNVPNTQTAFNVGQRVRIRNTITTYMEGLISSFSGTTMQVIIDYFSGTAIPLSVWFVSLTGDVGTTGATGPTGLTGNQGNTGATGPIATGTYLSSFSNVSQIITTATPILHDVVSISNGINPDPGTAPYTGFEILSTGVYKLLSSVQFFGTGGNTDLAIWGVVNGTNVPDSATYTHVRNGDTGVITVELILSLTTGDIFQWYADSVGGSGTCDIFVYNATLTIPLAPGIITDIYKLS